jgi:Fur family iron response transcriptional regulator
MDPQGYPRDKLVELLRKRGINPTHQRIEIAHALYSRHEHLSADQVLAIVNQRHPETSRATVYNTLNLFVAKRLLRELVLAAGRVVFDPNVVPHHHFIDDDTGAIHDVPWEAVKVLPVAGLKGYNVRE